MINLSKSGDTIVFEFDNNDHYLQQGTIEVPVNSLSLVTDNSQMATFKKAASNDIFVSALYSDFGMTKDQLISWYKENMVGGAGLPTEEIQEMIDESISSATSGYADSVIYNDVSHYVEFYHNGTGGTKVYEFDASDFIVDGMIDDVRIETIGGVSYLVIDFNTASGKQDIQIPLTDIFDPSNYYTKTEVDSALSAKTNQSDFTAYVTSADSRMLEDERVTAAALNALNTSLGDKADTSAMTEAINAAVSGKVDVSTFETYSGNVETELGNKLDSSAYTPFNLPIYKGKGDNSLSLTQQSGATQYYNNVSGFSTTAIGAGLKVTNPYETGIGVHNMNTSAVGNVFGQSGATLFSVGNGGGASDRHNAFEVKQNGDIYIADTNNTTSANYYEKPMAKLQDVLDGKQDTLSAGTNITISGNVISAEGGGKAVSGGTNISVTTGETEDTINCTLPIFCHSNNDKGDIRIGTNIYYADSDYSKINIGRKIHTIGNGNGANSIGIGVATTSTLDKNILYGSGSVGIGKAFTIGRGTSPTDTATAAIAIGYQPKALYKDSIAIGREATTNAIYSVAIGSYNVANAEYSFNCGKYNASNTGSTDADNTLFSVGNGTSSSARHNAFEIRQNGDIYITSGGTDIKLQDNLGGSEPSTAITSGDTNAVAGGAVYDKFDEVETVTAAALNDLNDAFGGLKIQKVTQAEYDALVSGGTVDNNILYVVV